MSKTVVTNVSYTYGSISGYVDYLSVSTGSVPDTDDLKRLQTQINSLEEKVKKLEKQNELLITLFKKSMGDFEKGSTRLVDSIIQVSVDTREKILNMLLNTGK